MSVKYRRFGRSGWEISEISFGAWQLGGEWGPVDDDESVATLLAAYEAGVNFVDTAQMYGTGHSETIVGRSLREWTGEKIHVATKAQPVAWPAVTDEDPSFAELYPNDYLIAQVEGSLRRLNVDRIDVFQLHCWAPDGLRNLEWFETLSALKDAGKIDRIGVSIRDYRPDDGVDLAKSGLVDSIQVIYNIFEQEPNKALFAAAAASETAIVARVALDSGALSGAWTPETYARWGEGSVLHTFYRGERFAETLDHVERLKENRESQVAVGETTARTYDFTLACTLDGTTTTYTASAAAGETATVRDLAVGTSCTIVEDDTFGADVTFSPSSTIVVSDAATPVIAVTATNTFPTESTPTPTPTDTPTPTPTDTPTPTPTPTDTPTPTPTPTDTPTPTPTPEVTPTPTPTSEVTPTPTPTSEVTPTPTPTAPPAVTTPNPSSPPLATTGGSPASPALLVGAGAALFAGLAMLFIAQRRRMSSEITR